MKKRTLSFFLTVNLLIQLVSLPIIATTDIIADTNETEGVGWVEGIETPAIPLPDEEEPEAYTVTWKNYDGTVLETDTDVACGTTPTYDGVTPAREATAEYTYIFSGWTPVISTVTGDVVYTAAYTAEAISNEITYPLEVDEIPRIDWAVTEDEEAYTVTWKNYDGTVLETDTDVVYGTAPTYDGDVPARSATTQYSYTFSGWTPAVAEVTENITYTAIFTETVNKYTVTWTNYNGAVLETDADLAYGTTPTYDGVTPEREADEEFTYTFSGWTPTVSAVTSNVTYVATYISNEIIKPASDVKLTMTGGRARPETEIVIPVTISDNTGLAGLQLSLFYSDSLTLKSVETGDALNGLTFTSPGNFSANPITLLLAGETADDSNGTVFNLTFTVNADTPEGDYDINITVVDSYDNDMETVLVSNTSATVTVVHYTPGDVNGDGNVTARDITALSRYIAGGYNITVVEAALDINRDGNVTARDITTLSRYIAGGYGIELK
ncbi:MAG: hypothetical protein IJ323_06015 [Clostridia bacterium]|nr:hypothetical protein [Clostridia bacterium]MBQ8755795.1 hypothetical protein [Lentisphaeria bacterium]